MKKTYSIAEQEILDLVNAERPSPFKIVRHMTVHVDRTEEKTADFHIEWVEYGKGDVAYRVKLFQESMWAWDYWNNILDYLGNAKKVTFKDVVVLLKSLGYEEIKNGPKTY